MDNPLDISPFNNQMALRSRSVSPSPQFALGQNVAFYTHTDENGPDVSFGTINGFQYADGAHFKLEVVNGEFLRTLDSTDSNICLSVTSSPGRTQVHERTHNAVTRATQLHTHYNILV
jgi:hypothetical protein